MAPTILRQISLLALLLCVLYAEEKIKTLSKLPEENMSSPEIIAFNGYPAETHYITTEDGYILALHRIPHGKNGLKGHGYPVFLQHGIVDSSATFLMNSPNKSLAFILADQGYDVWLGNSRGNTYCLKHIKYTTKDAAFWDFSFDEMAKYDLPASINYVLKLKKVEELYYVGHSQGTTTGFIEFSQNKELARKIKTFFALAPVAKVGNIKGAIKFFSYFTKEIDWLIRLLGIKDFLPSDEITKIIAQDVCGSFHLIQDLCKNIAFLIAGFDRKELNATRLPVYVSHLPAGTSVKDVLHFAQLVKSRKFQMYDYGSSENMKKYNQPYPPQYNLTDVSVPTVLYYGGHDWLADPTDVEGALIPELPNIVGRIKMDTWDHLDFVWGIRANKYIYSDMVKRMNLGLPK